MIRVVRGDRAGAGIDLSVEPEQPDSRPRAAEGDTGKGPGGWAPPGGREGRTRVFLLVREAPRRSRLPPEGGAAGSLKSCAAGEQPGAWSWEGVRREQRVGVERRKGREGGEGNRKDRRRRQGGKERKCWAGWGESRVGGGFSPSENRRLQILWDSQHQHPTPPGWSLPPVTPTPIPPWLPRAPGRRRPNCTPGSPTLCARTPVDHQPVSLHLPAPRLCPHIPGPSHAEPPATSSPSPPDLRRGRAGRCCQ